MDKKCKYDKIIHDKEMVKNIKTKSKESYAQHINRLLVEYAEEVDEQWLW